MRPAPWIARERGADGVLRLGLHHVHHTVLVGERPAQDDEARVHEAVHEGRVRGPIGLFLQRPRRVPLRAGAAKHDEERRHARVLPHGPWRPIRAHPATTSAVGGRPGTVS
jgi:hypothetical protein